MLLYFHLYIEFIFAESEYSENIWLKKNGNNDFD